MKQIQLCDYGCGQLATYQFKSGKWCCESNTHRCPSQRIINSKTHIGIPSVKKGKKYKNTKHNFEEIKTSKLCDYGCGNIAKYKFDNKKVCCSKSQNSCPEVKSKNRSSNIGIDRNTKENKEASRLRMLNGLANRMNEIPRDPEKEKTKSEKQRLRMLNGQAMYVVEFSKSKECHKKIRKNREEKGKWTKLNEMTERQLYHRLVLHLTNKSIQQKFSEEELKTRGTKFNENHIDHIFSEQEGFNLGILPIIISCKGNLRLITCFENSGKNSRCDISLDQLLKIYKDEINSNPEI